MWVRVGHGFVAASELLHCLLGTQSVIQLFHVIMWQLRASVRVWPFEQRI